MNRYMVTVIILLCISLVAGGFYYYRTFNSFDIMPEDVSCLVFKDAVGNEVTVSERDKVEEFLNLLKHAHLEKHVSASTKGECDYNIKVDYGNGKKLIEIGTDNCKLMCVDNKYVYSLMVLKAEMVEDYLSDLGLDIKNTEPSAEK